LIKTLTKIKYDKKLGIYYKHEKDYNWIIRQQNKYLNKNIKLSKNSVFQWKKELIYLLNKPNVPFININQNKLQHGRGNFCQSLNLNSFKSHTWEKIEDWKIKILYLIDEYLQNNNLIRSKRISVQFIGSLGSFSPISYSDFDCLIILPLMEQLSVEEIYELKKLYNFLNFSAHTFDPLQHHDIFVITEDELIAGIPGFYPLELLKNKWGYGRDHFYYPENINNKTTSINFIKNNQYFRRLDYNQELPKSIYHLKYILSCIYLMPAYFYNAKNETYSKKESIDRIKNINSHIKIQFDWLSEFRIQWPVSIYPLLKRNILMYGFNTFSLNNMVHSYRKIDYFFKRNRSKHPFLKYSFTIIRKARIISDLLLELIIKQDAKRR